LNYICTDQTNTSTHPQHWITSVPYNPLFTKKIRKAVSAISS